MIHWSFKSILFNFQVFCLISIVSCYWCLIWFHYDLIRCRNFFDFLVFALWTKMWSILEKVSWATEITCIPQLLDRISCICVLSTIFFMMHFNPKCLCWFLWIGWAIYWWRVEYWSHSLLLHPDLSVPLYLVVFVIGCTNVSSYAFMIISSWWSVLLINM
jgi:hypothetical protein